MPHDVDHAGVPAAGQHHQATSPQVHDEGLIIDDEGIVLPLDAGPCLVGRWHAALEVRGPIDLPGDEDTAVDEQ